MTREETEELIAAMTGAIRAEMTAQEDRQRAAMLVAEDRLLSKFHQHVDEAWAGMKEFARDLQTEVLKAVLTTQEGNVARLGGLEAADAAVLARMAAMERRLLEIEKRLGGVA